MIKDLEEAVKSSRNIRQVIQKLGLVPAGANYKRIKKLIERNNLDITHFSRSAAGGSFHKIPLIDILVEKSHYTSSNHLRFRLLSEGVKEHKCDSCNNSEWLGAKISIELHHKNGNNSDNRLENIQFLCPNCHSLTSTYRRRKG